MDFNINGLISRSNLIELVVIFDYAILHLE